MGQVEIIPFSENALRRIANIIVNTVRQQKNEDEIFNADVMLYDLYFPDKRRIVSFFRRARLPEDLLSGFEQITTVEFLAKIQNRPNGRGQIIKIIEQLCDPEEYFDDQKNRKVIITQINEVLSRYNLKVSEQGIILTSPRLIILDNAVDTLSRLLAARTAERDEEQSSDFDQPVHPELTQQKVFVCYSHKDAKWLESLQVHLKPLELKGIIELWVDTKIPAGAIWREEIENALEAATVAVTLVSPDFLASDYISKYELPTLLLHAETRGTRILSVILSHCLFDGSGLDVFQTVNSSSKPLNEMSRAARDKIWVKLAKAIQESLERGKP